MAESALDSASYSVLSYYNKLLFDLYGLMGTDSLSEENINTLMNDYVGKTLGSVDVDPSAFTKILSQFVGDSSPSTFDGYDFKFGPDNADTPQITAELTANLANTDFVQYQLIEHMKYRAPISLLTGDTGLLAKLSQLDKIKSQIQAITQRLNITEQNKAVMQNAKAAAQLVDPPAGGADNSLRSAVSSYLSAHNAAELSQLCEDFNNAVDAVIEDNEDAMNPPPPPPPPESAAAAGVTIPEPEPPEPWSRAKWKSALMDELEDVLKTYKAIRKDAADLSSQADKANEAIDVAVGTDGASPSGYKAYIKQLEDGKNAADASAAAIFDSEIQSAKASAGALLKSKPFVEMVKIASDRITQADENLLTDAINDIAQELYDSDGGDYTPLSDASDEETDPFYIIDEGRTGLDAALSSTAAETSPSPNAGADKVDVKKAKEDAEKDDEEPEGLGELISLEDKEDDMEGAYSDPPADDDTSDTLALSGVDDSSGTEVLAGVTGIFDKLLAMLENQRDSLYIAQYIITYFPNYVNNYRAIESAPASTAKFNSSPYKAYCASQAEVEYILTGNTDTDASMTAVKAMLLGVRTAFNLAAIFTDPSKVSQANAIAAAISGPFAPAIAIAILVGWALAESAIDVSDLCSGKEVPVFKSGGDWTLSIEGLVDYVSSKVLECATDTITTLSQKAQSVANEAIYEAHTAGDKFVSGAKSKLTGWTSDLTKNLEGDAAGTALAGQLQSIIDDNFTKPAETFFDETVGNKASKLFQDLEDKALLQVSKTGEKVEEKLKSASEEAVGKLSKAASGKISETLGDAAGDAAEGEIELPSFNMGYIDYIQIFLLMTGRDTRTQRIQQLIQVNMRSGGQSGFKMAETYGAFTAELTGSIKFLFMSEPIVPAEVRQNGRLAFAVHSSVSY